MIAPFVTGTLALLSALINLWQWLASIRFPLHRRALVPDCLPGFSILKPLKGCDTETRDCLESWFTQSAPEVEILFGVADPADPVCAIVRELQDRHPKVPSTLYVCHIDDAPNAKAAKLAVLEQHAVKSVLIIADADVWAPPDFLQQIWACLQNPGIDLVNSFYALANPANLAMHLEAVAVNADFWCQVLQSRDLKPQDFALGAAMAIRREKLIEIGGFQMLQEYLADDYQLGSRVAAGGGRIALAPVVVECREAPLSFRQVWQHQIRWARTIRACQPLAFFFSILGNATFWPLFWLITSDSSVRVWVSAFVLLRLATAGQQQARLTRQPKSWLHVWLVPIKDLLGVVLWAGACLGHTVTWRGVHYRIRPGGKMVPHR